MKHYQRAEDIRKVALPVVRTHIKAGDIGDTLINWWDAAKENTGDVWDSTREWLKESMEPTSY